MRRCGTNEIFAVTGTRDGTSPIVRVRAGANHWRVTNSSGHFVCRPAGRSRCGQVTLLIQRDRSDGAVSILIGDQKAFPVTARAILFGSLHLPQSVPAFLCKKIFLVHQFDPVFRRERFRPRAIEHDMRRFFHYQPGEVDRIFYMLHTANCAGLQCLSVHNGRVHLVCAGAGKYRTAAGVEMRIVLEHSHSRFRCIETRSATLQNFVTSLQRVFKPCSIFTLFFPVSCCCAQSFRRRREWRVQFFLFPCLDCYRSVSPLAE